MIYKDFKGLKLSALGLGCMRLPLKKERVNLNTDEEIDEELSAEMVACAMEQGVNYYDTAWGYHCGNSELVIGKILKEYPRNSFYLASKFPGYDLNNMPKVQEIFEKQLEKCQVEYFDFYLVHNVCEMNIDAYLDPQYGIYDYLMEQKKNGRIKHLGFSTHGSIDTMKRFYEAYGEGMEFCQIELNYFDWKFQDAEGKTKLIESWGIPVWVMEPVRGGQLAAVSEEAEAAFKAARPESGVVEWAFRFLQSLPQVCVTLSGMSDMEQLKQNIATYAEDKPLNEEEMKVVLGVADEMISKTTVPCTACHYCVSHCPMGLDIPTLLSLYNEAMAAGSGDFISHMGLAAIAADKQPSSCIACGSCAAVCPQQIQIPDELAKFAKKMGQ